MSIENDHFDIQNCPTESQRCLQFTRVLSLSYYTDLWDNAHNNMVADWDSGMEVMAFRIQLSE